MTHVAAQGIRSKFMFKNSNITMMCSPKVGSHEI